MASKKLSSLRAGALLATGPVEGAVLPQPPALPHHVLCTWGRGRVEEEDSVVGEETRGIGEGEGEKGVGNRGKEKWGDGKGRGIG